MNRGKIPSTFNLLTNWLMFYLVTKQKENMIST